MTQTKQDFILGRIAELVDKVVKTESIPENSQSFDDLELIKFYAKDLASKCEGCKEAPHGSENEKQS